MRELILYKSKWICGSPLRLASDKKENTFLGDGWTYLLNDEGYQCCLGQWIKQLNPELDNEEILGKGEPDELTIEIEKFSPSFVNLAIQINDNPDSTIEEKIASLTKLCEEYGYELKVQD